MGRELFRVAALAVATVGYACNAWAQPGAESTITAAAPDADTGGAAEPGALRAPISIAPQLQTRAPTEAEPRHGASSTPRAAQPGLALSLGAGTSYVALGVQAGYVIPFGRRQFSLVGGVGVMPGLEEARPKVGVTGGVQAAFGLHNRLLIEVGISPAVRTWQLHGVVIAHELVYGPYALLAYEYLWEMGLFVRIGGGLHAPMANDLTWVPALSTGVGWKF